MTKEIKLSQVNKVLAQWGIKIVADDPPPDPGPPDPPDPPKPPPDEYSTHYSHYNPASWIQGGVPHGVSITFCPDSPQYETVTLNGEQLRCHTRSDRGRQIWTNYDFRKTAKTRISGVIVATEAGGKQTRFKVSGESTYMDHRCDCFRKYRD